MQTLRRWCATAAACALAVAGWGASSPAQAREDVAPSADEPALALRIGQYNLPGPDKLHRASTRARRAAELIRRADLDVVALNELVGTGRHGRGSTASAFARQVRTSLGGHWRLVVPTTRRNENYLAYREDRLRVVYQHADRIVPGIGSGRHRQQTARHVTPVLLEQRSSHRRVLIAGTHLVSGDRAGARRQARDVGRALARIAGGTPVVVAGDMNTSDVLGGLTSIGLADARRRAAARTNADVSTYVRYDLRRPKRISRQVIDQVYVPVGWQVASWTTAADAPRGRFRQPRPSDHLLVWASVQGPPEQGD